MTAVQHSNNEDWWLILLWPEDHTNQYAKESYWSLLDGLIEYAGHSNRIG
jgi:hypothetical protein